jgi:dihydrofolate reductase
LIRSTEVWEVGDRMRKVSMIMFGTLDGIAEFPDYPEDPDETAGPSEELMWSPRMDSIDTIFLGRKAYAAWAGFWPAQKNDPSASEFRKRFSRFAEDAEKVVFSKTLKTAEWPKSRIVRGGVLEEVERLRKLPGKDMAVGGGPRLAQSFLAHDLVDELLMEVFPSLVGSGKPLFGIQPNPDHPEDVVPVGAPGRLDFRLLDCKPLQDGTLFLHYRRRR